MYQTFQQEWSIDSKSTFKFPVIRNYKIPFLAVDRLIWIKRELHLKYNKELSPLEYWRVHLGPHGRHTTVYETHSWPIFDSFFLTCWNVNADPARNGKAIGWNDKIVALEKTTWFYFRLMKTDFLFLLQTIY